MVNRECGTLGSWKNKALWLLPSPCPSPRCALKKIEITGAGWTGAGGGLNSQGLAGRLDSSDVTGVEGLPRASFTGRL